MLIKQSKAVARITGTYLPLAHVSALPTDNAIDSGSMVKALDKGPTLSVHKGVLQSTEQNSVELLDIVLIGSLTKKQEKNGLCTKISGHASLKNVCVIRASQEPTTSIRRDNERAPAKTILSHAFFSLDQET